MTCLNASYTLSDGDGKCLRKGTRGGRATEEPEGSGKERKSSCSGGFFRAVLELINGLIKKSNQLYEAYAVCHSVIPFASDCIAFVGAYQDIYRGRTDYFHGKASGDITVILLGRRFVAFSLGFAGRANVLV